MSCPTCDKTMHGLGNDWFWCHCCGTIKCGANEPRPGSVSLPSATQQLRNALLNPTPKLWWKDLAYNVARDLLLRPEERGEGEEK